MRMDSLFRRCLGRFFPGGRERSSRRGNRYRPGVTLLETRELLSAGLVAAYSFDQGSGTTLVDDSGNGNNGTLANAAWVAGGRFGGALQFNGSPGSLVTVPDSTSLHLTAGMTLEAWVKPTGLNFTGTSGGVVLSESPDGSSVLYAAAGTGKTPAGRIRVAVGDTWARGPTALKLNVWTFLAATYDGTTLRLYVNGRQAASTRAHGPLGATGPLHLGGSATAGMFAGLLDNVRIYNRALGRTEILADMGTPVSGTAPGAPAASAGPAESGPEGGRVVFAGSIAGGAGPLSCSWAFGDGGTAAGTMTPSHVYANHGTYTATLSVTDALGRSSQSSTTVTVNDVVPHATLSGPSAGTAGTALAFTGGATDSPVDTAAGFTYAWAFGDGTTSAQQNPGHTYASAGTYTVTLTVTDQGGLTGSAATTLQVAAPTTPAAPAASAGPNESGPEGGTVTFAGSATGGAAPLSYAWAFGDGGTATGSLSPTHLYANHGTYTSTLTVTDALGRSSQSNTTVTVSDPVPQATLGGATAGTAGTALAFTGSASDSPVDTAAGFTYAWAFGDGTTSAQQNPSHAFTSAGTYTVTLTVTDQGGLTGSASTIVQVAVPTNGPPVPPDTDPYLITPHDKIPNFGAHPTITSVQSGNWSSPATWSLGRLPAAGDVVDINPGTTVTYDVLSNTPLNTLEVQPTASLQFRTDINTRVVVGNFLVLPGGSLQVGTQANPVAANVLADIVFANQAINTATDPEQFGTGLIVLGKMTSYGAARTPFVTLAQEAHAGDTVLHLAAASAGWQPGDDLVLPDTRQLSDATNGSLYHPQWEERTLGSVSADGLAVTLTAPLQYDHLGARDAAGVLDYLPQLVNRGRSIMFGSQDEGTDPGQTRGYVLFTDRADVDVRNTGFCELGRTTATAEDDTTFDSSGHVTHLGTNEGDRTAMTARHLLGPTTPQADGYQFSFVGNAVADDGPVAEANQTHLWGLVLNDSHYGLIRDNVVYNAAGSGMGVEDGASSYNVFDHNFVVRVVGTSARTDKQLQGTAFWFNNPNNHITNNVATDVNGGGGDVFSYGFNVDASYVGTQTVPAFQGADPSQPGQGRSVNMNDTPLLEFAGNEAYGAIKSGLTLWWIGTSGDDFYANAGVSVVKDFVAWNFFSRAIYGYPVNNLTIDGLVVRGDVSALGNQYVYTTGINFDDYMTRNLVIENSDIQGMEKGIKAPIMVGRVPGMDTTVIQNCYLDNRVNVYLSPPRSVNGSDDLSPMTLNITNVRFAHPHAGQVDGLYDVWLDPIVQDALGTSNFSVPQYVYVYAYNGVSGDNFEVFYPNNSPTTTTRPYINGYVEPI
jgi:PKD repeat protein